jgi:hypothetical protein
VRRGSWRVVAAVYFAASALLGCGSGDPAAAEEGVAGSGSGTSPLGVVTLRRLNKTEYSNTLRDLTGTVVRYGDNFPPENLSFGFDNIGEALTVQPLHFELLEQSAQAVIDELFTRPPGDPMLARTVPCDPASGHDCIALVVRGFAERSFRRRVTDEDILPFITVAETYVAGGGIAIDGLKFALQGVLLSPHFLYRVELDADPASSVAHALNSFELASRLSYFLWSTMPDDPLFVVADTGTVGDDNTLTSEVARMLADGKARALVDNFAGQWLNLRRLDNVTPDYAAYPSFDEDLRVALRTESELFFSELLQQGKPLTELLTANYTYVNARLAQHYGLPAPAGGDFVRVELTGSARGGFLTQGSFLTLTSNPTRTSPVKRGKWVLDQLLCAPPPPPPPGVDTSLSEGGDQPLSLRARLEAHRADPACAGCHTSMDPIGLSFENFDGIGGYRTEDPGGAIDASGVLPTAGGDVAFSGPLELAAILIGDSRFDSCVTRNVLTYATGRGFGDPDAALIESIAARAKEKGGSLTAIIESVVLSDAFRTRRALAGG